jgi:hypothetical protein
MNAVKRIRVAHPDMGHGLITKEEESDVSEDVAGNAVDIELLEPDRQSKSNGPPTTFGNVMVACDEVICKHARGELFQHTPSAQIC